MVVTRIKANVWNPHLNMLFQQYKWYTLKSTYFLIAKTQVYVKILVYNCRGKPTNISIRYCQKITRQKIPPLAVGSLNLENLSPNKGKLCDLLLVMQFLLCLLKYLGISYVFIFFKRYDKFMQSELSRLYHPP